MIFSRPGKAHPRAQTQPAAVPVTDGAACAAGVGGRRRWFRRLSPTALPLVLAGAALCAASAGARAAPAASGVAPEEWSYWRLPTHYSTHGDQMDRLYYVILAITMVTFVAVWITLGVFLVKYRHRPDRRKGVFTHGNTRLEMVWTLIPAVILIVLALWTKRAWDNYRYSPTANSGQLARILVVGQQFKWNVVYPGPDGKLGRYLVFPKTTDLQWPASDPDDPYDFPKEYKGRPTPGPAFMPEREARTILNGYIEKNSLGKDFSDPDGKDDDWKQALGRTVFVPKGRPVEINLSSKDVIHDFFLPNFRVKLDAVPGMRGLIYFTATKTTDEVTLRTYKLDDLAAEMGRGGAPDYWLDIPLDGPTPEGIKAEDTPSGRRYYRLIEGKPNSAGKKPKPKKETVAYDKIITTEKINDLRAAGFTEVAAYRPWDLVCEELCGAGHTTMKGDLIVLEPDEYKRRFEPAPAAPPAGPAGPGPSTRPAEVAAGAGPGKAGKP